MTRLNLLLILFCSLVAHAQSVGVDWQQKTNYLSASYEHSQLTLPNGSISGEGVRADFDHYFKYGISFDFNLSMALNDQNLVSTSFTGLGAYFYYSIFGNFGDQKKTVLLDNAPVLSERTRGHNSFEAGLGLDQLFLNGTTSVYSVSGLGLGAKYRFVLFKQDFEAAGRYSVMSSGSNSITGMFISLGMSFPL